MSRNPDLSFAQTWGGENCRAVLPQFMTWCYPGGCRSFLSSFPSTRSVYCDEIFNSSQSFSSIDQKTLLAVTNTAVSLHSSRSPRNVKNQMVRLPNKTDSVEKGKSLVGMDSG